MLSPGDNHYAQLGLPRNATVEEIRRAYHDAARRLHPDVNDDPQAKDHFLKIQEAYDVLSQPMLRAAYDESLPEEQPPPVSLSSRYSRSTLARIQEPQLIYVLLELNADRNEEMLEGPPLNVCLVLDRWTSMQGRRLDTLKSSAKTLVNRLRPHDYLSIVTFSDRAEVLIPATRGSDYGKVEARISLLQAGGSTEIYSGLRAGYQELLRNAKAAHVNHLILITDGRTYGDEDDCLKLAENARARGVTFSGLGIGAEWNDDFLDELTGRTGGSSQYVTSSEDIKKFLEEKFTGLSRIYAEGLMVEFEHDPGVELKYAFRLEPEAGPLPLNDSISLGSIPGDASLKILLEFFVSSVAPEAEIVRLMCGDIRMDIPTHLVPAVQMPINLDRPTSAAIDPEPPPQPIVKAMSRLTLYRMQEEARHDLKSGNFEEATRRLQNLATHLLSQGERNLARTVLAEVDRIQQGQALSEQGEKRIKYGTRALLLPRFLEETSE